MAGAMVPAVDPRRGRLRGYSNGFLHRENHRGRAAHVGDVRQQREDESVNRASAETVERNEILAFLRAYEEGDDFAQILAGQLGRKKPSCVIAFGNSDEARHAVAHLATYFLKLGNGSDSGVKPAQPRERIFPHRLAPGVTEAKDSVEQRTAFQAQRPAPGAQ